MLCKQTGMLCGPALTCNSSLLQLWGSPQQWGMFSHLCSMLGVVAGGSAARLFLATTLADSHKHSHTCKRLVSTRPSTVMHGLVQNLWETSRASRQILVNSHKLIRAEPELWRKCFTCGSQSTSGQKRPTTRRHFRGQMLWLKAKQNQPSDTLNLSNMWAMPTKHKSMQLLFWNEDTWAFNWEWLWLRELSSCLAISWLVQILGFTVIVPLGKTATPNCLQL